MSTTESVPVNGRCANGNIAVRRRRRSRQRQPDVVVHVGQETIDLSLADLADPQIVVDIQERCQADTGTIRFSFRDLLALPDGVRFQLFSVICGLTGRVTIEVGSGQDTKVFDDVFDAAIATIEANGSVQRAERSRRAAVEAAALRHPDALLMASNHILRRLRAVGVSGATPQSLVKEARALAGADQAKSLTAAAAAELFVSHIQHMTAATTDEVVEDGSDADDAPTLLYYLDDFYIFQSRKWQRIDSGEFRALVTNYLQQAGHEDRVTTRFLTDVLTAIKGMSLIQSTREAPPLWIEDDSPGPFQRSPYLAFQNGILNLEEALSGHADLACTNPRHFSTTILPYNFDPDADCPLWRRTIYEILRPNRYRRRPREDQRIQVLQEFMGYTILQSDATFEKFLVMVGDGANGKSTVADILVRMLGEENVSHVPLDRIGGEFRLWQMMSKQANIVADMNRMEKVEEGLLKSLVSGDPIQINRKNQPPVTMRPTAKLIFGTNNLPPINDRSNGVWRRMITIPFLEHFDEDRRDRRRAEQLRDELPGIFNWVLAGARRLLQQDGFTPCAICSGFLSDYRITSDPIAQFVESSTWIYPDNARASVLCKALYGSYQNWCEENGRRPVNSADFGKQIRAIKGVGKDRESRGARQRKYTGISLSPIEENRRRRRPRSS